MTIFHGRFRFYLSLFFLTALTTYSNASEIPTSADDISPILVGQTVPDITLENIEGKSISLAKLLQQKPTLLIFYRGSWCPYCNTHLAELRKIEAELLSMGFQIVAVSPDLPEFLQQTMEKNKLNYQLVSDSKMQAAKALGLAYKVDDPALKTLQTHGIQLDKNSGETHQLLPVPAALLINKDLSVAFSFIAPNYKIRVDNGTIIAAAKAMKKSGE